MNARLPFSSTAISSTNILDMARIFEPEIQIAEWQRPAQEVITAWLEENLSELRTGWRQTISPGDRPDLNSMPPGAGRNALASDLQLQAELMGDLLACDRVGLRLEVISQAMCPRFHIDRVGIRMLCTYRGPGTEWIDASQVNRQFLGRGAQGRADTESGLLLSGYVIEEIKPFSVALLKGSLWQGNAEGGAIHRSPHVTTPPRVLVAIDADWD